MKKISMANVLFVSKIHITWYILFVLFFAFFGPCPYTLVLVVLVRFLFRLGVGGGRGGVVSVLYCIMTHIIIYR